MTGSRTPGPGRVSPGALVATLAQVGTPASRHWFAQARARVRSAPPAIVSVFAEAGRQVGNHLVVVGDEPDPEGTGWLHPHRRTAADAARVVLLADGGTGVAGLLEELYRYGSGDERRALLHALPWLPLDGEGAPLVADAVRGNDPRLLVAALSSYGLAHLGSRLRDQAVLKCVFTGIPLESIPGLAEVASPELARMLAEYVHERVAAGRTVAAGVWPLIEAYPPRQVLAAIESELAHPDQARSRAAAAALAVRTGT